MGYKLKKEKAKRGNYGSKRLTSNIEYLVYHYTANDGDTDEANASYFKNNLVEASAHAFVDDDSVTISVPANYVAWAVGGGLLDYGSPYRKYGAKYLGRCTNSNSYSIEMCDTRRNGRHDLTQKTRENAIEYGAKIMIKYDIDIKHVIRHFDVNGKLCPIFWVTDDADWKKFKKELQAKVKEFKNKNKPVNAVSEKYTGSFPTLPSKGYFERGCVGTQVKYLQMFLNWALALKLDVDGIYGASTEAAVKQFQSKYKLEVDGLFGAESLRFAKAMKK